MNDQPGRRDAYKDLHARICFRHFSCLSFLSIIRKVDTAGSIQTVADVAGATPGWGIDGVKATSSKLFLPDDVKVDSGGNLYVVDHQRIRKVNTVGIISTLAGQVASEGFRGYFSPAPTSSCFPVPESSSG